ncbi:MAG: hypothetical protein Q8O70_10460, partial [Burkholderiales bacterium]|nr:hypothetical protein [Burkholderiales bacterium]
MDLNRKSKTMPILKLAAWVMAGVICFAGAPVFGKAEAQAAEAGTASTAPPVAAPASAPAAEKPGNDICLSCHGNPGFAMPGADGNIRQLDVAKERFENSVHGKRLCVECH